MSLLHVYIKTDSRSPTAVVVSVYLLFKKQPRQRSFRCVLLVRAKSKVLITRVITFIVIIITLQKLTITLVMVIMIIPNTGVGTPLLPFVGRLAHFLCF